MLAALLPECRRGDEAAWTRLYSYFRPRALRSLAAGRFSPEDAEEILQETFLKLAGSIRSIRDGGAVRSYVYASLQNCSLDFIRRGRTGKRGEGRAALSIEALAEEGTQLAARGRGADSACEDSDTARRLEAALERLPEDDRRLVRERFIEGRDFETIARERGARPNTLTVRCHRLLKRLRKEME